MQSDKIALPAYAADSPLGLVVNVILWAYLFTYAVSTHKTEGDKSEYIQKLPMWKRWVQTNIHDFSVTSETDLDDKTQYIFTSFPHGAISANHILSMTDAGGFLSKIYRGERRDLAASVLFYLPVVREILLLLGNVDAGAVTAKLQLSLKRSLLIFVGGEKEQLMTAPKQHKIFARTRFGFVKLALLYGAELVPMYTFGENEVYHISHKFHALRHWLQRNLSMGISLFHGDGWHRLSPLKGTELHMEVAAPVPMPARFRANATVDSGRGQERLVPSKEDIEAYHSAFLKAQKHLFERTKGRHGVPKDVQLEIL